MAKFSSATSVVEYLYDSFGRASGQQGAGAYPVTYGFNEYGDQNSLSTYRIPGQPDVTTWAFDPSSGLLHYKQDAAGQRTTYAYHTASAQAATRTWARQVGGQALVKTLVYDVTGRVSGQTYSDDTPPVSYSFRRDGSLSQWVDAAGSHTYADHSPEGIPQLETISGDVDDALAGLEIRMPVDGLGRRVGYQSQLLPERGLVNEQAVVLPAARWSYGSRGELARVSSGSRSITFEQAADATSATRTLTRQDTVASSLSLTTVEVSSLAQGMRTITHSRSGYTQSRTVGTTGTPSTGVDIRAVDPDFGIGNYSGHGGWRYTYDSKGQVLRDRKLFTLNGTNFSELSYRDISRNLVGDSGGFYEDNSLNQRTMNYRDFTWVDGLALDPSSVMVNDVMPAVEGKWFGEVIQGTMQPQWKHVEVTVPDNVSSGLVLSQTGKLYIPPQHDALSHDADGNLTDDARWKYHWDAENRLKQLTTQAAAVTAGVPELRLSFSYDAQSRRVRKKVEEKVSSVWELRSDVRFIYDGWNLMAEVEYHGGAKDAPKVSSSPGTRAYVKRSYVWGPDVSGSWDGAGGVGGLLALTRHERGTQSAESYWVNMDLNGNVIGLVSSTQADRYAVYDYDGYGLCIRANEPEEGLNAVRFSSKYTDVETGLVYYGYRYYSPVMTQWISRDPIGEKGGVNLYGMVGNDVVTRVDYLGKKSVKVAFVFDDRASQSFNNTMFPGNTMPEWEARARSAMADLKEVLDRCNDLGVKIDCSQVYGEWSPLDSADPLGNDQLFGKNPLSGSDLPGGFDSLGNPGKLKTPPPAGIYDALKELNKKIKWPDSHFHVILTGRWTSGLFKVNGMAGRTDNLILLNMSASKWTLPHEMGHVIKWIDAASQKTHSNEKSNLMYTDGSSGQPDCQWCHKLKDYINK